MQLGPHSLPGIPPALLFSSTPSLILPLPPWPALGAQSHVQTAEMQSTGFESGCCC